MKIVSFTDRDQWRAWLEVNHRAEREIWLLYYKKATGRPSIPYEDSVQEAICFGWIDGIIKKVDKETYVRKFTPRVDPHRWSQTNLRRAQRMIVEGRMTPAGLTVLGVDPETVGAGDGRPDAGGEATLPAHFEERLRENGAAWERFIGLSPYRQRLYVRWIMDAKREETRARRLDEAIGILEEGKELGMK